MQPEYPLQQRVCILLYAGERIELAASFQALGAFGEQIYSSHTEAKLEELKKSLKPKSSK
jgi:hypothetical protein